MADAAHEMAEDAGEAIGTMAEECRNQAAGMVDSVKEFGTKAGRAARESFDHLRETAGEYVEKGRKQAVEAEHSFEGMIRSKPLQSLMIAVGVGFVAGFLMTRSSD